MTYSMICVKEEGSAIMGQELVRGMDFLSGGIFFFGGWAKRNAKEPQGCPWS